MAASASANSSATVACFLLLLALAVVVSAVPGSTRGPAAAPSPSAELHKADDVVVVVQPVSTERRRCDSDKRWNEQLCRNVCGMFKFYGHEFNLPAADAGGAPSCCCCPGGATCTQL